MKKKKHTDEFDQNDAILKEFIQEADKILQENPDLFKEKPAGRMSVKDALESSDPLENIRNEMGEKDIQKLFSLLYSAIMEVNSAGAGILFDRYNKEEMGTIYNNYKTLGAEIFCNGIEKIREFIKIKLGETYYEDDYFELCDTKEYNTLDREITLQYEEMVAEMENALLKFARQNIEELENA